MSKPDPTLVTFDPPSLTDEPLSPLEREVRDHWKEHRPTMAASLEKAGLLDQQVRNAVYRAMRTEAEATASGLSPDQARELAREDVFLTPERPELTPDSTTP